MIDLEDLDLFPNPDRPALGAKPRCRRHEWTWIGDTPDEGERCRFCGSNRDTTVSRRNRNNRSRGGSEERVVASLLGGRKVGPLGLPHDVEVPGYLRVQVKKLDRWPSLARVCAWLDAMAPHDDVRAVSIADTPGPGGRTRRLLVVDLDEFARWHGGHGE